MEVPPLVVIVTCADVSPVDGGGTLTVHRSCDGQRVVVTCPLNDTTMRPSGLRKFEPVMVTVWPGLAELGARDEICGGVPGVDGTVVLVVFPLAVVGALLVFVVEVKLVVVVGRLVPAAW